MIIKKNNLGFTVLELVIVSGIMVFLLVITIANFRGFEKQQVLDTEAEKLASVLRKAQIWALTGQTIDSTRYSYGVRLNDCIAGYTCKYIFFKDLDGDKIYDTGEALGDGSYDFLQSVYVYSLDPISLSEDLDITFEPPLATVYVNGLSEDATVVLGSSLSSRQKTITVSAVSGQINVE